MAANAKGAAISAQINPMMMNAAISINIAVPKVATARKASAGDNKCLRASQFCEAPRPRTKLT